ncbi:MAG: hypothetical protein FD153_1095 [Rhodospirillaceae bacterium]|nr:MAG: hypothetical protein FD153_1095 [Rhodospirillaceae bacterium]
MTGERTSSALSIEDEIGMDISLQTAMLGAVMGMTVLALSTMCFMRAPRWQCRSRWAGERWALPCKGQVCVGPSDPGCSGRHSSCRCG